MNELKHLAIIADGNGRWATKRGMTRTEGHEAGLRKLEDITRWVADIGIPLMSVYVFSTENWNRSDDEIDGLMRLADQYFSNLGELVENGVRLIVSGTRERLSEDMTAKMDKAIEATKDCDRITVNLCINYGGRKEIVDAIAKGARTEEEISRSLYQDLPEPDLIIRTGGHKRLSNFLLWQSAYSELAFTPTLFPDFTKAELMTHINRFSAVTRNFGGLST